MASPNRPNATLSLDIAYPLYEGLNCQLRKMPLRHLSFTLNLAKGHSSKVFVEPKHITVEQTTKTQGRK